MFRLPVLPGGDRVEPGGFEHGLTYPTAVAPEALLFAPDRRVADLAAVPLRDGGTLDATSLPFEREAEELIQLVGVDGTIALHNRAEGYRVRLGWNADNKYSVAASAVGRPVELRAYADRIELRQDGRIVGQHRRAFGRGETVYDPWHYVPVLARSRARSATPHRSRTGCCRRRSSGCGTN